VESYIQLPPDSTGKRVRAFYRSALNAYEEVGASKPVEHANPVYAVSVRGSSVSASKHHLSIWNGSSSYLRILLVKVGTSSTATVSGFQMAHILQRATAVSGGTALTVVKHDPRDPDLPSGITAATGATVTLTEAPLYVFTVNPEDYAGAPWEVYIPPKPIVIAPSSGLTIQQYATAGAGTVEATMVFSVEVVTP